MLTYLKNIKFDINEKHAVIVYLKPTEVKIKVIFDLLCTLTITTLIIIGFVNMGLQTYSRQAVLDLI